MSGSAAAPGPPREIVPEPLRTGTLVRSATSQRSVLAAALVLAVTVAVAVACTGSGTRAGAAGPTGTILASLGASGGSLDSPVEALRALLTQRARALERSDAGLWAATVADPAGPNGAAEISAYAGMNTLGVRGLTVISVQAAPPAPVPVGPRTWLGTVQMEYAVPGVDRGPRGCTRTVTLQHTDLGWRIGRWLGPTDRWEAFDLPGLTSVRTEHALVVGPVPREVLQARGAEVEAGQGRVSAVLGAVVMALVVVPATTDQAQRMLGAIPTDPTTSRTAQVAATTLGERAPRAPALADRVIIDPVGLGRLTAVGRRVVLTHEMVHVTVRGSTLDDVPLWLSEGFAEWVAFGAETMDRRIVAARLLDQVRVDGPPAKLPTSADFAGSAGDPAVAYQGAWLAVDGMARLAGADGLLSVLLDVGGTIPAPGRAPPPQVDIEQALVHRLGVGEAGLLRGWQDDLVALAHGR